MNARAAISAFAHRSASPGAALQLLAYSGVVVLAIILFSAWVCAHAGYPPGGQIYDEGFRASVLPWSTFALADVLAVIALAAGLLVIAPAAACALVAAERRAGTLDQLRTTPLSPVALLAGLVVGAPCRIYLLLAGPLAFHLACGLAGVIPLATAVTTTAVLGCGGLASVLFGLTLALAPRQESSGTFVSLGVATLLGVAGCVAAAFATVPHAVPWAYLHPAGALHAAMLEHDGLWRRMVTTHWELQRFERDAYAEALGLVPLLSSIAALALGAVLAGAACRKLARPHLPLLSKRQGVVLFAGLSAGLLLPLRWEVSGEPAPGSLILAIAALLTPLVGLFAATATPTGEAWAMALRRGVRPRWSDDDAGPHRMTFLMVALFALLAAIIPGHAALRDRDLVALGWIAVLALSLPGFALYLGTRFTTPTARWAFGAATCVHLMCQLVAVGLVADRDANRDYVFVQACAVVTLAAPLWLAVAQRLLRRRTLAAVTRSEGARP